MDVRPAREGDLDAAIALDEAVAIEGRWIAREAPVDRIKRRGVFEADLRRPDANLFVADEDGAIVGLLGIELSSYGVADFGFEEEGLLRRQYRRRNGELWDALVMGLLLD